MGAVCRMILRRTQEGGPYYKANDHGSLALAGAESEPHGSAGHQSNTHSAQTCTQTNSTPRTTVVQVPLLLVCYIWTNEVEAVTFRYVT